tara:strand:- start:29520 stop:30839 length:1320 start_codon:yes stop_codon:yes gene_type:complete
MSTQFTKGFGKAATGLSLNNDRRLFNFGERIAELAPQQSPFFVYLSKVAKKPTDDPVFKWMERRHQWQRRDFKVTNVSGTGSTATLTIKVAYGKDGTPTFDADGNPNYATDPSWLHFEADADADLNGNTMVRIDGDIYAVIHWDGTNAIKCKEVSGGPAIAATHDDKYGQIIGSAFDEAQLSPDGWVDELSTKEAYCQIFKTAIPLFSNTAMATRYRGIADEFKRVWQEKLMEHKMDLEQAFLFGSGSTAGSALETATRRYTNGIVTFAKGSNGCKNYNMTYAGSSYDSFMDIMEDYFAPESGNSGNKLVLASRKIISWMNKLGDNSFMGNTVGTSNFRADIQNITGNFGHEVMKVSTIFGNLFVVQEPLFRLDAEDTMMCVDLDNVAYRPLVGNGINRDTFIETNIQANDMDGRKDQIITEAGLEIKLPETHALITFS